MRSPKTESKKPLVLVAEDDATLRRMIKRMLEEIVDVVDVEDGARALEYLRSDKPLPDLLLTDIMMPGLDGLSLAQRIRDDRELNRMPVIMLTARSQPMDVIGGINAGARHYLTKPFKHEELVSKVKSLLRLR